MTNIKRVLSLALAAVMLMGMMVIGAGAANVEYTDAESIENAEAVEVLTALDVLGGYPDGSFKPEGTLTRAEAAAIICRIMLGADVAESLSTATAPFADVKATNWAAGYLAYLKNLGVISGIGNNKYNPQGTVTVGEFAKMLLGAAGVEGQYTGSSWLINVSVAAQKAGILTSKDVVTANATRDAVAGYTMNTLNYAPQGSVTKYVGTPVGGTAMTFDTFIEAYVYANGGTVTTATEYPDSLAETVFGLSKSTTNTADAFGRPQTAWVQNGKEIAVVVEDAVVTYTTTVKGSDLYEALGKPSGTVSISYLVDGASGNITSYTGLNAAATWTIGGNGVLTQVYKTGDNSYTITEINTHFDTVDTVTPATATAKEFVTLNGVGTYEISGLKAGDTVLYTKNSAKIVSLEKVEAVEVTPTSYSGTKSFVANGTTYEYSDNRVGGTINAFNAVKIYLDNYGYVINIAGITNDPNYAVVLSSHTESATWPASGNTYKVQLLKADGSVEIVEATAAPVASYTGSGATPAAGEYKNGDIVTYTVSNGKYELTGANATEKTSANLTITKGSASLTYGTAYNANAKTIFLVRSGAGTTADPYTYASYTGIANVPSLTASSAASGEILVAGGFAKVVYITGASPVGTTSSENVFVSGVYTSNTVQVNGNAVTYYTADAMVNGTVQTMNFANNYAMGLYTVMGTDANGYTTLATTTGTTITSIAKYTADSGVITINGTVYAVSSNVAVYTYNTTTGALSTATLNAIQGTETAGVFTVDKDNANIVTAIYIPVA